MFLLSLFAEAQLTGDGFYRVQNYGSKRYAYLCDKTGSINYTAQSADVGAMQLWLGIERAYDDPGSIIYVNHKDGNKYDLLAQGTGLYEIIGHYVEIDETGDNQYQVYATMAGFSKFLGDQTTSTTRDRGVPGFEANGKFRLWSVFAVNSSDNYLGITPTIHVGGKHYQPYYVSFAFQKISAGMKVYYIKKVDNEYGIAVMEEITGDVIPAETPVIIECPGTQSSDNKILPVTTSAAAVSDNKMGGVYFCNPLRHSPYTGTPFVASTMRTLCVGSNGKLGFNNNPTNLTVVELDDYIEYNCLPANSSYLKVQSNTPAELQIMTQAEYDAFIDAHTTHNATSVTLSQSSATLLPGQTLTLTATVLPENTTNKAVTWKSSNTAVATVENGVVTAKSVGSATITVTTADGTNLSATCEITVNPIVATSVVLDKTEATMLLGDVMKLNATVAPENATNRNVTWKSSDEAIAKVAADGTVTALGVGSATITVTTADGTNLSATCQITVNPILASSVTLDKTSATVLLGGELQLTATVGPENTTNKAVTWKSTDETVVTVTDGGKVKAVGLGTANVVVTTADGSNLTATCQITVDPVLAESIALNRTLIVAKEGETVQLVATVLPSNTTNAAVVWSTDNEDVAVVDETGLVTVKTVGQATITVTTTDGTNLSAHCAVTSEAILAETITISQTTADVKVGDAFTLTAVVAPDNTTTKDVTWSTDNTDVAVVTAEGHVVAVGVGEAVITATTTDGSQLSASCAVKVSPVLVEAIALNAESVSLTEEQPTFQLVATVTPDNATYKELEWSSSDDTVVAVSADGLITLVGNGDAVITVKTTDGTELSATCLVNAFSGILTVGANAVDSRVFNASGMKMSNLKRGLNIVVMPDGTVRKVMVK